MRFSFGDSIFKVGKFKFIINLFIMQEHTVEVKRVAISNIMYVEPMIVGAEVF